MNKAYFGRLNNIPILTYHKLTEQKENNLYHLSKKDFQNQIKYLYDNNYETLLIDDFYNLLNSSKNISPKFVIITFDDGHKSDFNIALPILLEYKLKATFFITTDWVDNKEYMSREELRRLNKEGMSVQSHAKSHNFLDNKSINIYNELAESKKKLEHILGDKVSSLSFPGGRFNGKVLGCSKKTGYKVACCSVPFHINSKTSPLLIGRCMIKYNNRGSNFYRIINSNEIGRIKMRFFYYLKSAFKAGIGDSMYYFFWKKHSHVN